MKLKDMITHIYIYTELKISIEEKGKKLNAYNVT